MKYKVTTQSRLGHKAITEMLRSYCSFLFSKDIAKILPATRDYSLEKQYTNVIIVEHDEYFDIQQVVNSMHADKWIIDCFYKVYLEEERVQSIRIDYKPVHRRAVPTGILI